MKILYLLYNGLSVLASNSTDLIPLFIKKKVKIRNFSSFFANHELAKATPPDYISQQ